MPTSPSLPQAIRTALEAISTGARPADVEDQHLDFKEDPATTPARNPDARRIEVLLDATVCFANADGESHIILGLRDKAAGPAAFTGTDADAHTIRAKIFHNTRPPLTVDVTELDWDGVRLLDIRIPQGLTVYSRSNGAATIRDGDSCRELTDRERQAIAFARANPDYTARPSSLGISDLDPAAMTLAQRLLEHRSPGERATSAEDVLRRLGVLDDRGTLTVAGEILLASTDRVLARHLWRRTPGAEPSTTEYTGPLLLAMTSVRERISALSDPENSRVELPSGLERPIPDFPAQAVDESVTNAFVHRDWASQMPIDIDHSPIRLSIDSPGPLPHGVQLDQILSTRSMPRNVALMRALHRLGLVEETSRGFDRMWVSMLRDGRTAPHVQADNFHVSVTFTADAVDTAFIRWLSALDMTLGPAAEVNSLNALLVLKHLESAPVLSGRQASVLLQVGISEARAVLGWMVSTGVLQEAQGADEWQLSGQARNEFSSSGGTAPQAGAVEHWVMSAVQSGETVTNRAIASATGTPAREVTQVLRYLANTRRIKKDPDGPTRGPGVRWIAADL